MAFEQRDMGGVLFKNDRKQDGDRMPDYKGNCLIEGKSWEIGAWIKDTAKGGKLLSLKFSTPFKKSDPGAYVKPPPVPPASKQDSDDDSVPF